MSRHYDPRRRYLPDRDVRTWDDLVALLREDDPVGLFWPLLGPRRSGKSWALAAIKQQLGGRAHVVDLSTCDGLDDLDYDDGAIVLVDEPGRFLFREGEVAAGRPRQSDGAMVQRFFAWCDRLRTRRNCRLLVAMTPAEWLALQQHGRARLRVSDKDLQSHLRPLSPEQALRIAQDEPARALLMSVQREQPDWLRNPFLVMYLLDRAHDDGVLAEPTRRPVAAFLADVIEDINQVVPWNYTAMVFHEGLGDSLQEALRRIARREPVDPLALAVLKVSGLVEPRTGEHHDSIRDPVVADLLPPPLRIHHISDIHAGPKSAQRVNVHGAGVAARLGKAAGQGPIRRSYLDHVRQRVAEGTGPHLVIVSGDLTETGRPEEYEAIRDFLAELAALLRPHPRLDASDPRVLVVGGNHDVDWGETRGADGARKRHIPFARELNDYPRPHLEDPPASRNLTVLRYARAGVEVVLLGSAEHGGEIDHEFLGLVEKYRAAAVERGAVNDTEEADRLRARLGRLDPGLVHHADLARLRAHDWREPVRLAVLHHPVSPMPSMPDVAAYTGLLNAGAVKEALIDKEFTLVLHGHMHSQWYGAESWPGRGHHTLRIAAAPSLGSTEVYERHGYNEVLLSFEGESQHIEVHGYVREGDAWHPRSGHPRFSIAGSDRR